MPKFFALLSAVVLGAMSFTSCNKNEVENLTRTGQPAATSASADLSAADKSAYVLFTYPVALPGSGSLVGHTGLGLVYSFQGKHYARYTHHSGKVVTVSAALPVNKMSNGRLDGPSLVKVLKQSMGEAGAAYHNITVQYLDASNAAVLRSLAEAQGQNGRTTYDLFGNNCVTYARDVMAKGPTQLDQVRNMALYLHSVAPDGFSNLLRDAVANSGAQHIFQVKRTGSGNAQSRPNNFGGNFSGLPGSYNNANMALLN